MQSNHRYYIRVDISTRVGGAQEGQVFGLKIKHLNLSKIVNKINYHSFHAFAKVGAIPNYTNSPIQFNLILLGQLFSTFFTHD